MRGLLMLTGAALMGACSIADGDSGMAPTGAGTQRSWTVADFQRVELAGVDDVEVRVGPAFSVRAEGAADVLDRLRIDKDGDTLEIGRKPNSSGEGKARVLVTLPQLKGTALAGSGSMTVDRVAGGDLQAEIAGSGQLRLQQLAVETLDVEIAGSGTLAAAGVARRLEVDVAGSGNLDARGLSAGAAEVSIAGSGNVRATVTGKADVQVMGSGDVDLGPGARCDVSKTGSGTVTCGK